MDIIASLTLQMWERKAEQLWALIAAVRLEPTWMGLELTWVGLEPMQFESPWVGLGLSS